MGAGHGSLESVVMRVASPEFWKGRRTLVTGHTGFKGSWLSLLLSQLGAEVSGIALDPPTLPALFEQARVGEILCADLRCDVASGRELASAVRALEPEVVFHLAAQPLVRNSYERPSDTFGINVMGTVNVLEACRELGGVKCLVVVTTDKVYVNREWCWAYREDDTLGARDPYSASKACVEMVAASYRSSFVGGDFPAIGTARAGNVIGGGDWAVDRLIPDCIRAFRAGAEVALRFPHSVRPWQHVLDCLHGYVLYAESLFRDREGIPSTINFGPASEQFVRVSDVVELACRLWGAGARYRVDSTAGDRHEAGLLRLDSTRARTTLAWKPVWRFEDAMRETISWYGSQHRGDDARELCVSQILDFLRSAGSRERT